MYDRVSETLDRLGYKEKYLAKFQENEMDDEMVEGCLAHSQFLSELSAIIPVMAHRVKFVSEFKKILNNDDDNGLLVPKPTENSELAPSPVPPTPPIKPRGKVAEVVFGFNSMSLDKTAKSQNLPAEKTTSPPPPPPRPSRGAAIDEFKDTSASVTSTQNVALQEYWSEMNDKISTKMAVDGYVEVEDIQQFSRNAASAAIVNFNKNPHVGANHVEILNQKFDQEKQNYEKIHTVKFSALKTQLDEKIEENLQNYRTQMSQGVQNRLVLQNDLQFLHQSTKVKVIENFSANQKVLGVSSTAPLFKKMENLLLQKIESEFTSIKDNVSRENQNFLSRGNKLVTDLVTNYKLKMAALNTIDEAHFNKIHEESKSLFVSNIRGSVIDLGDNGEQLGQQIQNFEDQIQTNYFQLLLDLKDRKEKMTASFTKASKSAQALYEKSMTDLFGGGGKRFFNEEALDLKHSEKKKKAIDDLKNSLPSSIQLADDSIQLQELTSAIDLHFETVVKEKNRTRQAQFVSGAKNVLGEAKNLYSIKVKNLMEDYEQQESAILLENEKISAQSLQFLAASVDVAFAQPQFVTQMTDELKKHMTTFFADHLELYQLRQEEDEVEVKRALFEAKMYYNEEMDKHFKSQEFLHPATLAGLDKKICKAAIDNSQKEIKLTKSQEDQLRKAMRTVFLKYHEKNLLRVPTSNTAIGIDLGTTYSCVAVYLNDKVVVIPNEFGHPTTPSYVSYQPGGSIVVGEVAKSQSFRNPQSTIFDAKRLIGRKFSDPRVQADMKVWPFRVVDAGDDVPKIKVDDYTTYHPEEVSAQVLKKMKNIAEEYLGREVTDAVITVPALFTDGQRQATRDAGEIAGLNVLKILNEPTAAAIAYQLHRTDDLKRNVLIFDLGGGTFDTSVLTMTGGKIKVAAVHGDTHLGGEDFDGEMVKYCIQAFKEKHSGVDLSRGRHSKDAKEQFDAASRLRRIRNECEVQKSILSVSTRTDIVIDMIDENLNMEVPLSRILFEQLNEEKFADCIRIVEKTLEEAKMTKEDIDDIVLVGGSTRIPKIQEMLSQFFSDKKALSKQINPDEAVAHGAAIQAAILSGQKVEKYGQNLSLEDVTPVTIGIKNYLENLVPTIPKNTPVPCSVTEVWVPVVNGQTRVNFKIYEGEETKAADNNLLGNFILSGIPAADAGVEKLDVTMTINEEGILHTKAVCRSSGSESDVTITALKKRLTRDEIHAAMLSTR